VSREFLTDVFEELGLALGGLLAIHDVPDKFVVRLFRDMEEIHDRAVRRADPEGKPRQEHLGVSGFEPHPAVEEFLRKLRRT